MSGVRQALVLAAGRGSRMGALTDLCPKALLAVGGVSLLERQLRQLAARGVERVVVVGGYRAADLVALRIARRGAPELTCVENARWMGTGSGLSLLTGATVLAPDEATLLTHGDLIADDALFDELLSAPGNALLADGSWQELTGDEVTVRADGQGRLLSIDKRNDTVAACAGEYVGLLRLEAGTLGELAEFAWPRVQADPSLDYELHLLGAYALQADQAVQVRVIRDLAWRNLNDAEDLAWAERQFGREDVHG